MRICLSACLSVGVYVCNTMTFESLDVGSSLAHPVYLDWIRVKFVYEGHRVKITGAKVVGHNHYSRNVKL